VRRQLRDGVGATAESDGERKTGNHHCRCRAKASDHLRPPTRFGVRARASLLTDRCRAQGRLVPAPGRPGGDADYLGAPAIGGLPDADQSSTLGGWALRPRYPQRTKFVTLTLEFLNFVLSID